MAYIKNLDRTRLTEIMYSRWHSPDRRLYTWEEVLNIGVDAQHQWWSYEPRGPAPALPVQPLTAQTREGLKQALPF